MYFLYTCLLLLGGLGWLPRLLWRGLHGATYHHDLAERLGRIPLPPEVTQAPQGCLWFHAASVGEVQGIQPIMASLHARFPVLPMVLSTFTPAGKRTAQRVVPEAAAIFVLPLDLPWSMRRLMRRVRPRALIIEETELWPQLCRTAAQRGVPVVLVNGRLSARAFQRYRLVHAFMQRVLATITLFLVQSATGATRLQQLGADPQRVHVIGNTNIDRALLSAQRPAAPHPLAPVVAGRRLIVAGSTHEGEEAYLLAAYHRLCAQHYDLCLVLAPRHLERVATVVRHAQAYPYPVLRRSQAPQTPLTEPTVVVLDTMGELATLYRLCTLAFIGGSLVPIGGHNALEAAVFAKPLLFGPYMHHFPELAALLCQGGGARQVRDAADLYDQMAQLLAHPHLGVAMGQHALEVLAANRGALERTVERVASLLQTVPKSEKV